MRNLFFPAAVTSYLMPIKARFGTFSAFLVGWRQHPVKCPVELVYFCNEGTPFMRFVVRLAAALDARAEASRVAALELLEALERVLRG